MDGEVGKRRENKKKQVSWRRNKEWCFETGGIEIS